MLNRTEVAAYAQAMRESDPRLDGSLASLAVLDALLAQYREALFGEGDDELPAAIGLLAGAYFGEVLLTAAGGDWRFSDEGYVPRLAGPGCEVSPFGRVQKFFAEGPENDLSSLASAYVSFNALAEHLEVGDT